MKLNRLFIASISQSQQSWPFQRQNVSSGKLKQIAIKGAHFQHTIYNTVNLKMSKETEENRILTFHSYFVE